MDYILRSYFDHTYLYTYHILLEVTRSATCTIIFLFYTIFFDIAAVPRWGKPVNVLKHAPVVALSTKSIASDQLGSIVQDRLRPKTTTTTHSPAMQTMNIPSLLLRTPQLRPLLWTQFSLQSAIYLYKLTNLRRINSELIQRYSK